MKRAIMGHIVLAATLVLSPMTSNAQNLTEAEQQLLLMNLVEADVNSDSAISRSEFEVLINLNAADNLGRAALIVRTGRYDTAFQRIDANGDGFLSEAELQALAQHVQG